MYVYLIVGGERTKDAKELLYARQKLVLVAKAFQLQAIDLVHIDYKGFSHCSVINLSCYKKNCWEMRMTLLLLGLTCNENDFIAARTNM